MSNKFRTALTAGFSTAVLLATTVAPVIADSRRDDGDEPGQSMSALSTFLWFVVLPLAIYGIIALLVMGPGWVSAAKKSSANGFLDDPTADSVSSKPETAQLTYE